MYTQLYTIQLGNLTSDTHTFKKRVTSYRIFSRIFRKKLGWECANYQDSTRFLSIHSMLFMNFYDVCTFSFFFCKFKLHGQQNHNNKVISIPAYSAGSSWSAIFQILPLWNIFHCKILAVRYIFIGVLDDCIIFKFDIRAAKKPDKTRSPPVKIGTIFGKLMQLEKCLVLPP